MCVKGLKDAAMFLFEPIFIPFGERQKPRARPAGVLGQQNDRKASPFPGKILKPPEKVVFYFIQGVHQLLGVREGLERRSDVFV